MNAVPNASPQSLDALHAHFLSLVPRIETHGRIYFRHLRCQHQRNDAIAEMVALGWLWFLRLVEQNKDVNEFVGGFVILLARAVNSGRRLAGMAKIKDVMSKANQKRNGFQVEPIPLSLRTPHENLYGDPLGQQMQDALEEILHDNTHTPVPDQVAFRQDFPAWRRTRSDRDRRMIEDLMLGERTLDVAEKYGMTPGRVSQLRRDLMEDWTRFTSAEPACDEQRRADEP